MPERPAESASTLERLAAIVESRREAAEGRRLSPTHLWAYIGALEASMHRSEVDREAALAEVVRLRAAAERVKEAWDAPGFWDEHEMDDATLHLRAALAAAPREVTDG